MKEQMPHILKSNAGFVNPVLISGPIQLAVHHGVGLVDFGGDAGVVGGQEDGLAVIGT